MAKYSELPCYLVGHNGIITVSTIAAIDGLPIHNDGRPLTPDGKTESLKGWTHSLCDSYEDGKVLIPASNPRNAGRKPKGRILCGWRLAPDIVEAVAARAAETGQSQNDAAEELLRSALKTA